MAIRRLFKLVTVISRIDENNLGQQGAKLLNVIN